MEENFHSLIPSYNKPLECTCVPPKKLPMSIPALDTGQKSMQQIRASVAIKSAGSGASLPGLESAFSSLRHRLMKTKPHLVYPS